MHIGHFVSFTQTQNTNKEKLLCQQFFKFNHTFTKYCKASQVKRLFCAILDLSGEYIKCILLSKIFRFLFQLRLVVHGFHAISFE